MRDFSPSPSPSPDPSQVRDFTGNEEYKFGDITKAAVSKFTGKDEYEFGDITKKVGQMLFGNKQART